MSFSNRSKLRQMYMKEYDKNTLQTMITNFIKNRNKKLKSTHSVIKSTTIIAKYKIKILKKYQLTENNKN